MRQKLKKNGIKRHQRTITLIGRRLTIKAICRIRRNCLSDHGGHCWQAGSPDAFCELDTLSLVVVKFGWMWRRSFIVEDFFKSLRTTDNGWRRKCDVQLTLTTGTMWREKLTLRIEPGELVIKPILKIPIKVFMSNMITQFLDD